MNIKPFYKPIALIGFFPPSNFTFENYKSNGVLSFELRTGFYILEINMLIADTILNNTFMKDLNYVLYVYYDVWGPSKLSDREFLLKCFCCHTV